jgi:hypothetical protein
MKWLNSILREVLGLFVDDGSFALAILIWLGALWVVLPHLNVPRGWDGVILFAGLALILVESAWRRARNEAR